MDDIDVLAGILAKDTALVRAVRDDQLRAPTPCSEFDVERLVRHATGWLQQFAAGANGRELATDPEAYVGRDPAGDFERAAAEVVEGWRVHGLDRQVRFASMDLPGPAVLAITVMEYVTHGGDLAVALGAPAPFSDEELTLALERARQTLLPEYRGEGQSFGPEVPVPDDAPAFQRLMAFMGRRVPAAA
jgi:uncharacterized protein (TIGR03086 family)